MFSPKRKECLNNFTQIEINVHIIDLKPEISGKSLVRVLISLTSCLLHLHVDVVYEHFKFHGPWLDFFSYFLIVPSPVAIIMKDTFPRRVYCKLKLGYNHSHLLSFASLLTAKRVMFILQISLISLLSRVLPSSLVRVRAADIVKQSLLLGFWR